MVVFFVNLEVFGELNDACGQQRDLYFGRARVFLMGAIFINNFGFFGRVKHGFATFLTRGAALCSGVRAG